MDYRFLVDSTNIDNITVPYKTVLLEANVKINRMGSTELTYHKEQSFANIFCIFVFLKSLYRMVVSVYVYIFTEYIKLTAFQTNPVERQVETIASFRQKLE